MSDTVKKWHEMQEGFTLEVKENSNVLIARYIFVLNYSDGKVYRYGISAICTEENKWNPETESCEQFLELNGHNVNNCEWMVSHDGAIHTVVSKTK
jgi:hypothetical protein